MVPRVELTQGEEEESNKEGEKKDTSQGLEFSSSLEDSSSRVLRSEPADMIEFTDRAP